MSVNRLRVPANTEEASGEANSLSHHIAQHEWRLQGRFGGTAGYVKLVHPPKSPNFISSGILLEFLMISLQ